MKKIFNILFLFNLIKIKILVSDSTDLVDNMCPDRWFSYKKNCYVILKSKTDWLQGFFDCENTIAEYLSFDDLDEQMFIYRHLIEDDVFKKIYLGAEDYMKRGKLKWFKTNREINSTTLCSNSSSDLNLMKNCGIYDVVKNCIDLTDCMAKSHVICKRDCKKWDCLKLKNNTNKSKNKFIQMNAHCQKHKCMNNSTCKKMNKQAIKNGENKYKCICLPGYRGQYCEIDSRACSNFNCLNNSTCIESNINPHEFKCECLNGFSGRLCETNLACSNITCENNGVCIDGLDYNFSCLCGHYFTGKYCEIKNFQLESLENISSAFSAFAISFVCIYVVFIMSLDVLKFIFKIEPIGLNKHRKKMQMNKLLNKIKREKIFLIRRERKLAKRINEIKSKSNQLKLEHFCNHNNDNFKWVNLKYIDETSLDTII